MTYFIKKSRTNRQKNKGMIHNNVLYPCNQTSLVWDVFVDQVPQCVSTARENLLFTRLLYSADLHVPDCLIFPYDQRETIVRK